MPLRRQPRSRTAAPSEPSSPAAGLRRQTSAVPSERRSGSAVQANLARLFALTDRQFGLAKWRQMRERGVSEGAIRRWTVARRLHLIHPGVYSVVPPSLMTAEAWHGAAILAGGDGACLCCGSAAWWAGLVKEAPPKIHVAVAWDLEEREGIAWHRIALREGERVLHRRLPMTAPVRIPLDVAGQSTLWELKGILAELEFHHGVGPAEVATTLRRGYAGSAKLRRALAEHTPALALTRSELEKLFARFLSDRGFALPAFNAAVGRSTVDAVYRAQGVVIELDGVRGHSGERRVLRDHRRDLHRRADGLLPIRYHFTQLVDPADQQLVEAELERLGIPREPRWATAGRRERRSAAAAKRR